MLRLTGINYSIGDRDLLSNINLIINPGQRSALLGVNGSGKTTLLKIIYGELEQESGNIMRPNDYKVGYLPQELTGSERGKIINSVKSGRKDILTLEKRLTDIRNSLDSSEEEYNNIKIKKLGDAETEFDSIGGYDLERKAKKILFGLGFTEEDLEKNVSELSGGWQMRVNLAKLLISEPDLLLLDEPTNHLDIKAIEWLEKFLINFRGSVLAVTHDRFFIDRVTNNIFELSGEKLGFYSGGYDFFIKKKKADEELEIKKMKELLKKKEHLERFINRFRYKATKARQVKSREKEYEKLDDVELISAPEFLKFNIKTSTSSYLDVMSAKEVCFKYKDDWVLNNLNLNITKGDRIALIGENGCGKTTLAKLISGELLPQKGEVIKGERTDIGFYAQHQAEVLDPDLSVFEAITSEVPETDQTVIRTVLGLFGFSGDDIRKKIGILSGGEKSRVSLSRILMTPQNFLIMDEPTNHLDSISRDALESALRNYEGTLLLISHDRYFLDKIVTRVIELKAGGIYNYDGNYSYFLSRKEENIIDKNSGEVTDDVAGSFSRKVERKLRALSRQEISAERRILRSTIEELESGINDLELEKRELDKVLSDHSTYQDSSMISTIQKKYSSVIQNLESLYKEWEITQNKIDMLMSSVKNT
ncbi:MAG: ABC-F family ATP-binding cassette domain-containing protein [Candidatus Aminicenantes bacterium]|nr:ABC-F family ATP-binding cassette domain-containing protein [Candidatus Aminicenantes bacterium]